MKVIKRHTKLVDIVRKKNTVSVADLAKHLDTSRETIRRDLTELGKSGKILKIHGGATLPRTYGESSFQDRMSKNAEAKTRIAKKAAEFVLPDETLFLNTGTTTLYFAEELGKKLHLTVATNSAEIARTVATSQSGNQVFLLGGEYAVSNRQTLGAMVTAQIATLRAHHCVLSIGALDFRTGLMEFSFGEAQLASAMIEQAQFVTVLADHSKFDALASFMVSPLNKVDRLICDSLPPSDIVDAFESGRGEIIIAD